MVVYTVGYSAFTPEGLLAELKRRGVEVVVDVRRFPRSKMRGFSQGELEELLKGAGVEYLWMGELGALGVRGVRAGCSQSPTFDAYVWRLYRYGPAILSLEELNKLAAERTAALLCKEEDWRHCHRQFIADYLAARGHTVVHIRKGGREEPHVPTPCYSVLQPPPVELVARAAGDFAHLCKTHSVYLFGGALYNSGGDIDVVAYGEPAGELPQGYDAQTIPAPRPDLFHLFVTRGVLLCGKPLLVDPREALENELREAEALAQYFREGTHPVLVCKAAKRLVFLAAVLKCGLWADTWQKATQCLGEVPGVFKDCLSPPPLEEMRRHSHFVEKLVALINERRKAGALSLPGGL
ncbi:DUF488 domain-containing protein [Pyrobaculum calidifontis]|uniref:DUF488 domain-containing protein n=1 Tax=Pyrobaculum calidifontis (strain DSM 21063 / JCM 11548 / VA1) TaxID=410359 RepID=A3MTC2_PYRCJ|nr:DUF488 family protein [Pyrobaculum calidifontis]ABO07889.1 protein of unknown function DUF1130 [Pyrobaculum calidifontis JCM 11548]